MAKTNSTRKKMTNKDLIDQKWAACGPCALCGHADARHRTLDTIRSRARAGDTATELAGDYATNTKTIQMVIDLPDNDARLGASSPCTRASEESDRALTEMYIELSVADRIAQDAGWPPTLRKALDDEWPFMVLIAGDTPRVFTHAQVIDKDWVRLFSGGFRDPSDEDFSSDRGLEVRVSSILWIVDSSS